MWHADIIPPFEQERMGTVALANDDDDNNNNNNQVYEC